MGLFFLIPGIILDVVHPAWFHGQYQVAPVLIWTGVILLVIQIAWFLFVLSKA